MTISIVGVFVAPQPFDDAAEEILLEQVSDGFHVAKKGDRLYLAATDTQALKAGMGQLVIPDGLIGAVAELTSNPEAPKFLARAGELHVADNLLLSSAFYSLGLLGELESLMAPESVPVKAAKAA